VPREGEIDVPVGHAIGDPFHTYTHYDDDNDDMTAVHVDLTE
jgi:hypothetical protein